MSHNITGRVQLLHDTEANWQSVSNSFIPLAGEACVTIDGTFRGRVKYGDGINTWGSLPYSDEFGYDGKSIVSLNHEVQLGGFSEALVGQVPSKTSSGLEWFTPVKTVYLGNNENPITPTGGGVRIPIAGDNNLGVVKTSKEIGVKSDGEMTIKEVDADKVVYDENSSIKDVLNQRTSWTQF